MDKESLAQLIEVSHAVGDNLDLVQAAGGNTSVKSPDGRAMAIKASGTTLGGMSESDGWVEMDVAGVLKILDRTDLPKLPTNEREARVLAGSSCRMTRQPRAAPAATFSGRSSI